MKKTFWKKSMALLLSLVMLLGTLPVQAFATDSGPVSISTAEDFPSAIPAGAVYELADDITLSADQQITKLEGTLDGRGHTITVAGKALANEVTGTIQNLGIASSAAIGAASGFPTSNGSIATKLDGGTILNCFSTASLTDMFDDMGGLVGQSIGGTIRNSFFAGSIAGYLYGGLIGQSATEDKPSTITECYYTVGESPVSMGTHYNKAEGRFARKTLEDMQSPDFVELLNKDIQPTGYTWEAVPGALPRLAAPQTSNPQIKTAADLPETIPADVTYELAADIVLTSAQQITKLEGTLDGKGHTITVSGKALANEVTGTIQNLGVASSAAIGAASGFPTSNGSIATKLDGGTILNCFSTASLTDMFDDMGGLVGQSIGGTIRNSFFAGSISGYLYGGLIGQSATEDKPSTITECYYTVGESPISMGTHYNKAEGRFARKTLEDMQSPDFVELLNKDIQPTGFQWAAVPGALPALVSADGSTPETPTLNTKVLEDTIAEAKALHAEDFTEATWADLTAALAQAESTLTQDGLTQPEADAAAKALRQAIDALSPNPQNLPHTAVALPETGVIEITSQDQLSSMTIAGTKGKFYRLANDIVIDDPYWFGPTFGGVLDGNGHTITINNNTTLWNQLSREAVVQNVGFLGAVSSINNVGLIALQSEGLIVNCWSRAAVSSAGQNNRIKNTGGFVGTLQTGGVIANSYVAGAVSAKGNTGDGKVGALAAIAEPGTLITNCYWLNTSADKAAGVSGGVVASSAMKARGDFYSDELKAALNEGRGQYGKEWTVDSDGWLHLGPQGDFNPTLGAGMLFNFDPIFHKEPITFDSGSGLTMSLADALLDVDAGEMPRFAGRFTTPNIEGEVAFVPHYEAVGQGKHMVLVNAAGELEIQGPGSLTVSVCDKASWSGTGYEKEYFTFSIVVTNVEAEAVRLVPHGKFVDAEKNTVAGSGNVTVNAQVKLNGVWKQTFATMFSYTIDGNVFGEGDGFYAQAPGKVHITGTGFGHTAELTMESTYVPVDYIMPFPHGVHYIHGRNANSAKLGDFLDLELADHTGRVDVRPENASYRNLWRMDSSDPTVAEYIPDFLLAVLPYKAGKVTLTATSLDPLLETPVTGSTELELRYLNPVKSVSVDVPAEGGKLTVKENETISLPIHFEGTKAPEMAVDPKDGIEKEFSWHVSEPEMLWSFDGEGEVEITRDGNLGMFVKSPLEYCVANDQFIMTGVTAGTITVTGTPMDQTGGAKPVTFTVEVTPGDVPFVPLDIAQFVKDAKSASADFLTRNLTYAYGDEWNIFTLLRAGETLPKADLERYYDSVAATVKNWKATQKPTDIARVILPLAAMGKDVTDVGGVNLAAMLYNHSRLDMGSNEVAWALIALDAVGAEIPESAKYDRAAMVELLLTFQNEDGGFGLNPGGRSGADTTAMAMQALAPYQKEAVQAIEKGLGYLQTIHTKANHFDSGTCEANAQTVITLSVLGRDLAQEQGFCSSRYNLMTALNDYFVSGEGFKHDKAMQVNAMATVQAMQALDAYDRFSSGKSAYWDLTGKEPVTPQPAYEFISGANQKITQGSIPAAVVLELTGDVKNFQSVSVNDTVLDARNYTVDADSVTIRLQKAWLETLAVGTYKLTVSFTDGSASTRLYVEEAPVLPDPDKKVTVSFTLLGDEHHDEDVVHTYRFNRDELPVWMEAQDFTVPAGSKVVDVFKLAMEQAGYTYNLAFGGNYISEINGLAEFDNGPRSGWMYLLNGAHSLLGVAEQDLTEGDVIVMHYTDDYTLEKITEPDPEAVVVIDLINAIGTVTVNSGAAIQAARDAYNALTPAQKSMVSNYETLLAAEKAYAKLTASEADRKAAQAVMDKIDAIGTVTLASAEKIDVARQAYDALTATQKELVENYGKLTAAEAKLAQLQAPAHKDVYETVGHSLEQMAAQNTPMVGSVGGEWLILGLVRSGLTIPADAYYQNVVDFVVNNINDAEQLHRAKSTENARIILTLTAMGKDVTDVAGHNLLMGLTDMKYVQRQGINGPIWALIAFDSHNYEIPMNANASQQVTREALIQAILAAQLPDGGWDLAHTSADADMTGMALQALVPYYETHEAVKAAVDKALAKLSAMQNENGLFSSIDGASVESSAQVIVALTALGIDPNTDARFVKNGISAVDGLCAFAADDGFSHVLGSGRDQMATEQAYYALTAYFRFINGETALYDMSDVTIGGTETPDVKPEQPEVDPEDKPDTKPAPEDKPSVPDVEEGTQPQEKPGTPATGDDSEIAFFAVTMTVSLLTTAAFFAMKKRENF